MHAVQKFSMIQIAVSDMPKAKAFYADKLGMEVVQDFRQDDNNWWVSLNAPEGGTTITLTTHHSHMKPSALTLYFTTSDIDAAHDELKKQAVEVTDVADDLYGPGSGVKWFNFSDPDGNLVHIAAA